MEGTMADYEYITNPLRADEVCKSLRTSKNVAADTETTGVDPHRDVVTLLSLSAKGKGTFVIDTRDKRCLEAFGPLLGDEEVLKTFHNGSFDYQLIKGTTDIETENILCTMLGERSLTAGKQFDGYGLDDVTLKYLGKSRDKTIRESFIGHRGEFSKEQIQYAADDTSDLLEIAGCMQEEAKKIGTLRTWRIESAVLQSFADMEFYGQRIDRDKWSAVMGQNERSAVAAKKDLDKFFAPVCERMFNFDEDSDEEYIIDMDYDSTTMVLAKLRMLGVSADGQLVTDTNKKTQKKLQQHPIMIALGKYRAATHGVNQFGAQYLKAIHPVTGRVHFRFNQYGTDTGRPACRGGLNCLNIPREQRYRECFTTDEDWWLSTVDYSGAELRIMADLSGDPLMVKGFNSGVDFHCFVASMLFNKEVTKRNENSHLRTPTKTLNFGRVSHLGRRKTYSIQGNPTWTILSESSGNIGSVQRLTAQTERLWTGYATA